MVARASSVNLNCWPMRKLPCSRIAAVAVRMGYKAAGKVLLERPRLSITMAPAPLFPAKPACASGKARK